MKIIQRDLFFDIFEDFVLSKFQRKKDFVKELLAKFVFLQQ